MLYEEALALNPVDARPRVQAAHMYKEAGEMALAEAHYLKAQAQRPKDADLALQIGHFYRRSGRLDLARLAYERAAELSPGWAEPAASLRHIEAAGYIWSAEQNRAVAAPEVSATAAEVAERNSEGAALADTLPVVDRRIRAVDLTHAVGLAGLAPSLVPRTPSDIYHHHHESIDIRRLGRREPSFWGLIRTLRGVEAVRGFVLSRTPILEMQILLNGQPIYRGAVSGGHELAFELEKASIRKYVFNVWYDFGGFASGRYALEVRFTDADNNTRSFHERIAIAPPLSTADFPSSDALIPISEADPLRLERKIREAPSLARPAGQRHLFPDGIKSLLVIRTDQLGDMVASIPAVQRLRELAPDAKIVGLVTGANADLAMTLGLFNEVVVVDFPDDKLERRRLMPLNAQQDLRERLAPYGFDVAIDLSQSNVSRDLLRLSGAKFTYGHGGDDTPWMSGEMIFTTRDRLSAMDAVPHSMKVLALVEAFGAVLKTTAPIIRRSDLSPALLEPFGLADSQAYVLIHAGARIEFSRWSRYPDLAKLILENTSLRVVLISEDAGFAATLPSTLLEDSRFQFLDRRLTFDVFDALISYAHVVVGNDSGPKHLASLRGVNVVTLFTARIPWTEWGQENVGTIISRKVPCQGCAVFHDPEECGKGFACITDIETQEVFDAVLAYVAPQHRHASSRNFKDAPC